VINADLNGARNIAVGKPIAMGQRLTHPSSTISDVAKTIVFATSQA